MSKETADLIFRMFTISLAIIAPTIAIVLGMAEYNKRKIEESKHRSIGSEAILAMKRENEELRNEFENFKRETEGQNRTFRKDVLDTFFKPRTPLQ